MVQSLEEVAKALNLPIQDPKDFPLDCYVAVKPEDLLDVVKKLKADYGVHHLSVIIALEADDGYHLFYPISVALEDGTWGKLILDVTVNKADPVVDSLTPEIPGAVFYEREAYDMIGVRFRNLADHRRLLSADIMPPDLFPLKKEYSYEDVRDRLAEEANKRSEELE
ncbi:MAG: NADH-quinone oxidoreductase subunit C [Candidatus Hodarchaeota archaeon]